MTVLRQPAVIGLDIGTTGAKGILVTGSGRVLAEAAASYEILTPKPLWAEQWPQVWLDGAVAVLQDLARRAAEGKTAMAADEAATTTADNRSGVWDGIGIEALCISSLYGGSGVPCDEHLEPLHPALIWMDRRAVEQSSAAVARVGLERLQAITGNGADPYYGFTKVLWLKEKRPDVWAKTRHLVTPNAYLIYRLTGSLCMDYSSAGNIGGFFDLERRRWSDQLLAEFGIPARLFSDNLVASDAIVGHLTAEAAAWTGLPAGLPVVAGGIDAAVATFAAGVLKEGQHAAMIGTSMCWGTVHERGTLSPTLVSMPYVIEPGRLTYSFGGAATAGGAAKWFRDRFGQEEAERARARGLSPYALLDEAAAAIPAGSDGVVTLPYFMGERSPLWDPYVRAGVVGLTLYHTKAHVYRSILESVAYTLRQNMEIVRAAGTNLDPPLVLDPVLRLVGGVAASDLWTQIIADVTGYPAIRPLVSSDAPLGDALLAAKAVGLVDDYASAIEQWVRWRAPIQPQAANRPVYDETYASFVELYRLLKGFWGDQS